MDANQVENDIIYVTPKTKLIDILYQLQCRYNYNITWNVNDKRLILQFRDNK